MTRKMNNCASWPTSDDSSDGTGAACYDPRIMAAEEPALEVDRRVLPVSAATLISERAAAAGGEIAVPKQSAPSERMIDVTLEDSFPASDPPSWTLGI